MPVGWKHTYAGIVRKALLRRRDPQHWARSHQIKATFDLPTIPRSARRRGEVWAIFLVKNERDILPSTLRHAVRQGVDRILVVDNGSTDGTIEAVRELSRSLPLHMGFDREPAYYQSHKMTYLARWVSQRGAGWVVPMDADEFWFAKRMSLAEHLRRSTADIMEARLHNLFPTATHPTADGLSGPLRFDHTPHVLRKTALRAHPWVWLGMGNHEGLRPGRTEGGLYVAHLPWRSEEQYARKVRQGAAALAQTDLASHIGEHWRKAGHLDDLAIASAYKGLLHGQQQEGSGWNPVGPFSEVDPSTWATWSPPAPEKDVP